MLKASQVRTKRAAFSDDSMSSTPASIMRLVADDADGVAVEAGEAAHDVAGPSAAWYSRKSPSSTTDCDDLVHVVGLVRAGGHEVAQLGARRARGRRSAAKPGGSSRLFGGQEAEQVADRRRARPPRRRRRRWRRPTWWRGSSAPPSSSSVTSSPVTVFTTSGPVMNMCEFSRDHEDEVGHGRAVDRAAGARAEDHADLRDDARGLHVAVEDAAVAVEARRRPPGCGRRHRR